MQIHQALYGVERGGHAYLRGSDPAMVPTFKLLAWATDLPSTVPANVAWQAHLRGLAADAYFVLIYTKPDESATRAGMVISRAAFIPLTGLADLNDLSSVARVLREPLPEGQSLEPFSLTQGVAGDSGDSGGSLGIAPLITSIADGLVKGKRLPLVHFGQQGFDGAMLDLWRRLPGELRAQMSFGLSFGPQDTEGRELLVVCTPDALRGRWPGFTEVSDTVGAGVLTPATAAVLDISRGRELREFATRLDYPLDSFRALILVEQAHRACSGGNTIQDRINAVRLLASLSKSKDKGLNVKAEALNYLVSQSDSMTVSEVRSLRNLDLSTFPNSSAFWEKVEHWAFKLVDYAASDATVAGQILADAVSMNAVDEWRHSILAGVCETLSRSQVPKALMHSIWKAVEMDPSNVRQLLELLKGSSQLETEFCTTAPNNLSLSSVEVLVDIAAQIGLWKVCGTILAIQYAPVMAVESLLGLLRNSKDDSGIVAALSRATPEQKVAAALYHDDPRVTVVAGEACVKCQTLLGGFNIQNPVWFDILEVVLQHDTSAIHSVPSSGGLVDALITQTPTGTGHVRIWNAVARTPLGNLVTAKGRAGVWAILPLEPRTRMLKKTAEAWLERFTRGLEDASFLERELAAAVEVFARESNFLRKTMMTAPGLAVRYIVEVQQGSDLTVQCLIRDLAHNVPIAGLTPFDAETLGRAIHDKKWSACASAAFSAARVRDDFIPVIRKCKDLLGFFERMSISWEIDVYSSVSPEDLWTLLESEATRLYPSGPCDSALWSRSGGADEDLSNEGNGKARWHRGLKKVRSGNRVTPQRLLNKMREDYYNNKALAWLTMQQF
jgi:hypothetical protein